MRPAGRLEAVESAARALGVAACTLGELHPGVCIVGSSLHTCLLSLLRSFPSIAETE